MNQTHSQHPNHALIGHSDARRQMATPALIVELQAFERNLSRMARYAKRKGIALRPHAKTHKCAEIARRQIASGALGICCAKIGEAEALVAAGIEGVLVTSPVVTPMGYRRAADLNVRSKDFMLAVGDGSTLEGLNAAAQASGKALTLLCDVDIGLKRTGAPAGEAAAALALSIAGHAHLRYGGLQGYGGHLQHVQNRDERRAKNAEALKGLSQTRDLIAAKGLSSPIISGGGTGTCGFDPDSDVFTELQVGSYLFMDKEYNAIEAAADPDLAFETALFVDTTIIHLGTANLATTDAGLKSFATEAGSPTIARGAPEGAQYFFFGDEQGGIFQPKEDHGFALGQRLSCVTPHCDPTVNLYDVFHVMDGDRLVALWPIEARGRSA